VAFFDRQPALTGELLSLRPLRVEDFEALYAAASDPKIWELHPVSNRYERDVFEVYFREAIESGGALIATDRSKGEVIGSSRFHGFDEHQREIEIGWTFLICRCWGGDYNREMKRLMLSHAFHQRVDTVIFAVGPQNWRSQRAVLKLGAVADGTRADGMLVFRLHRDLWPIAG
jgi:N-acetyltransferase